MTDNKRIVYCLKLWIKELKETNQPLDEAQTNAVKWIVNTCEDEIFDGKYCSDDEYNEYLIIGEV